MKRCQKCGQSYSDQNINFCLNDGELLMYAPSEQRSHPSSPFDDDSPPTLVIDSPRVTNPAAWQPGNSPARWQDPAMASPPSPFSGFRGPKDQTLPTISLVLSILACFLVCCSGGIWLGLPAAIVGFLGMRNADREPEKYGGRGLAIGGMVLGIVTFLGSIVFLLISVISG